MKPLKRHLLFLILSCFSLASYAQNRTVSGVVTSVRDGKPLEGVNVTVKNQTTGTITNVEGQYSIAVPAGEQVLVFTNIGFEEKEEPVNGRNSISIQLTEADRSLDEVIVVGYGTQRKKDLTGAVSSVKTKDLVMSSSPEIGSMLRGKAAGLTVRQNSAQPGGGLDILIRGAGSVGAGNAPLIVVDGFPLTEVQQPGSGGRYQAGSQSPLNAFNPNDIESIEILKDASATAIYGSRAASGVILITTKRGAEGKPKIDYSNNFTMQVFKNPFDVLPLNEWMALRNEAGQEQWDFDNGVIPYGTRTREEAEAAPVNGLYRKLYTQNAINNVGRGTDWFDLVTRDGYTQQHNLSFSGGTRTTKYLVSGNLYDQKGIVKNSGFKRYSFRTNIDQEINKFVKLGINFTSSRIDNDNTQLGGDQFENSGIIRAAIQQGPHIPAIDENGNYPLNPQLALQPNPYSLLTITDKSRFERTLGNVFLDVTPIRGLLVRLKGGMDRTVTKRNSYIPTTTLHGALEQGRAFISDANNIDYLMEATATYNYTFQKDHRFEILGGASNQKFNYSFNSQGATGFITDAFLWNNLGAGSVQLPSSSSGSSNTMISFFGRLNYNYKSRYMVTGTIRRDGASVFARNNKWGNFPSVAVAWNVAEEDFFGGLRGAITQLKLRVGYGQTGKAQFQSNAFAAYTAGAAWLGPNDERLVGVFLSRLENPDLKWETTTGTNIGLDFNIRNGLVEGSFEFFNNDVSDLIAMRRLNSYQDIRDIFSNIGKTRSRGFEVTINTRNMQTRDFSWRTSVVASRYRDNWLERAPDWKPAVYQSDRDPINAMYYRLSDGILQVGERVPASQPELKPGMIKTKDIDGFQRDVNGNPVVDANGRFIRTGAPDGIIDDADTRLIGRVEPDLIAGITNIFRYKNWSLNFDFNAMFGRQIADPNRTAYGISAYGVYSNGYNALRSVLDRWTPTNPTNDQPSSFWGFSPYGVGDFFLEKAWFVRLQNISLGYTLPTKMLGKVFSSVTVHADAQNLFVISPYKGVDPETDSYTAAYPYIRSFTLGLNLSF